MSNSRESIGIPANIVFSGCDIEAQKDFQSGADIMLIRDRCNGESLGFLREEARTVRDWINHFLEYSAEEDARESEKKSSRL